MRHLITVTLILMFALGACSKGKQETPEKAAEPTAQEKEQTAEETQNPKADVDKAQDNDKMPEAQKADAAKEQKADTLPAAQQAPADDASKPFKANFASKEFPEIHTHVDIKDNIRRTTLEWADDIEIYHEIPDLNLAALQSPEFLKDMPAINIINETLQEDEKQFFTKGNLESAWEYEFGRHENKPEEAIKEDDKFYYFYKVEFVGTSDKYFSVLMVREWFMGGVGDTGYKSFNFDKNTGKDITLEEYYGKSHEEVKKIVKKAIQDYSKDAQNGLGPDMLEWGSFEKIEKYNFTIQNDIPRVLFNRYDIAIGAAGSFGIDLPKAK